MHYSIRSGVPLYQCTAVTFQKSSFINHQNNKKIPLSLIRVGFFVVNGMVFTSE